MPHSPLVDYIAGKAYVVGIVAKSWAVNADGMLVVSQSSGLGIALDRDRLRELTLDATPLFAG